MTVDAAEESAKRLAQAVEAVRQARPADTDG
jgi:hypothetical protein